MNLPLSVWSSFFVQLSPEEMVDEFAAAGYSVTEFSDEHGAMLLKRAAESGKSPAQVGAELKAYADAKGVSFPQGHLYLAVDLCAPDAAEILLPWLDLYVSLGVRAGVLHPSCRQPELSSEQRFERWVTTLKTLTEHLAGTEMSIALENAGGILLTAEALNGLIDAVGDEHLGICLDTGHLHLNKALADNPNAQSDFIRTAGKRLIALHIADNDRSRDEHLMPFGGGTVNFRDVMRGLSEIGYDRLFNLEIPGERRAPLEVLRAKLAYLKVAGGVMLENGFGR